MDLEYLTGVRSRVHPSWAFCFGLRCLVAVLWAAVLVGEVAVRKVLGLKVLGRLHVAVEIQLVQPRSS